MHVNLGFILDYLLVWLYVLQLVDELTDSFDKNKVTAGVFIDLAKAFDTIDHDIQLKKLQNYGITGVTLSFFRSSMLF